MNKKLGTVLVKKPLGFISKNVQRVPVSYVFKNYEKTLAQNNNYQCNKCQQTFLPSASCIICRKDSRRTCHSCGSEIRSGIHDSCQCLIRFSNLIWHQTQIENMS